MPDRNETATKQRQTERIIVNQRRERGARRLSFNLTRERKIRKVGPKF